MANTLISFSDAVKMMVDDTLYIEQAANNNELALSPEESGPIELWQDVQDRLDRIAATSKPTH